MMTKIITNTIMIIFKRYFELIFSKNQRLFDFYNFSLSAWFGKGKAGEIMIEYNFLYNKNTIP